MASLPPVHRTHPAEKPHVQRLATTTPHEGNTSGGGGDGDPCRESKRLASSTPGFFQRGVKYLALTLRCRSFGESIPGCGNTSWNMGSSGAFFQSIRSSTCDRNGRNGRNGHVPDEIKNDKQRRAHPTNMDMIAFRCQVGWCFSLVSEGMMCACAHLCRWPKRGLRNYKRVRQVSTTDVFSTDVKHLNKPKESHCVSVHNVSLQTTS